MKLGKKSTLVTAYSALFTVAVGLVGYDAYLRSTPPARTAAKTTARTETRLALATLKTGPQSLAAKKVALR